MTEPTDLISEIWKPILGWSPYEASSLGRIRHGEKIMRQRLDRGRGRNEGLPGYYVVALRSAGRGRSVRVHRAVLLAFRGECPDGMEGAHINGNSLDNVLENLKWATHSENCQDRIRHGTQPALERHGSAKLNREQVLSIRERYPAGARLCDLAREYSVNPRTIELIVIGKNWARLL